MSLPEIEILDSHLSEYLILILDIYVLLPLLYYCKKNLSHFMLGGLNNGHFNSHSKGCVNFFE